MEIAYTSNNNSNDYYANVIGVVFDVTNMNSYTLRFPYNTVPDTALYQADCKL